jgi:hypothetical protein
LSRFRPITPQLRAHPDNTTIQQVTLATDRGHEAWCNIFKCRIPFLNGGLFEPLADYNWRKTDIVLPNKIFTNTDFVEEGITGTGVLHQHELDRAAPAMRISPKGIVVTDRNGP